MLLVFPSVCSLNNSFWKFHNESLETWFLSGGLPWWLSRRRICFQCRRHRICEFDPWVRKISWRSKWQPTPVFLPEKSHAQKSLVGYGPRGLKESDTTKQLSTHNILSGDHHFNDVLSCIHSINLYFYSSYNIYIYIYQAPTSINRHKST